MRVWIITVGEPLPTEAVQKRPWRSGIIARLLAERGHDVVWWTSTVDHFDKTLHETGNVVTKVSDHLTIRFLHGRLYRKNISLDRFLNHWQIGRAFARLAPEEARPDLILCSLPTLELSEEAVKYGKAMGVPVLLDVRDLWPDEFVSALPRALQPLGRFVFAPMFAQARRALRGATGIVAISQTYLNWAYALGRRQPGPFDRVFTHGYPAPAHAVASDPVADAARLRALGVDPDRKGFWFIGTFVGSIDLSTVIEAARALQQRDDVQFVISGAGQDDARYRAEAADLNNLVFTGWVDRDDIAALSRHAYAGLGAYKRGALMSLTNKMFEYLAAGTPILLALPGEAEQIIVGNGAGLAYEPGNPVSLVDQVAGLADDVALHSRLSARAGELFETQFSAERIYDALASFLEDTARRAGATPQELRR